MMKQKHSINGYGSVSKAYRFLGLNTFQEAIDWTHQLPYGLNSDRADYMLIFKEGRGTCSTKHAVLAAFAHENGIDIRLQVAICKLSDHNEPKIAWLLNKIGSNYFPEAHCFLRCRDRDIDITFPSREPILNAIVIENYNILPNQIGDYKIALHQNFLRTWAKEQNISFEELWQLREEWISKLGVD